ncbi:MAG: type II toxin-antitoxin system RelE/ParE family toxin [Candidatus Niyogibacteria bacterium]|nr:type II toxin-antitoxin system RelE/ParE family toxin [Candidatus Niyogibacteria bacterium]
MYKVLIERRAERDLNALEKSMRSRVIRYCLKLRDNPRANAKKLHGSPNAWRIRIGDLRVIYEIDDKRREVKIYRIKHRSKAY